MRPPRADHERKRCAHCDQMVPIDEFPTPSRCVRPGRICSHCSRLANAERNRAYRARNADAISKRLQHKRAQLNKEQTVSDTTPTPAITWTAQEIVEFDNLVDAVTSPNQLARITARLDMGKFVQLHGKPKCDAMFAHLEAGGEPVSGGSQ